MRRLNFFRNLTWPVRIACVAIVTGIVIIFASVGTVATAVHLENDDEFCASCHTEPEVSFVNRSLAEEPVDLASAHAHYADAVRCIDCHSGAGTAGRVDALQQGATDLVAYLSGDYTEPAVTTNPLGDEPCFQMPYPAQP